MEYHDFNSLMRIYRVRTFCVWWRFRSWHWWCL